MDIIVAVSFGQGGFGDFLFAMKSADQMRKILKEKKIDGEVYLVIDKAGKDKIADIKPDGEFGITVLEVEELRQNVKAGTISPVLAFEGPTHLSNLHGALPQGTPVILASEYSLKPKSKDPSLVAEQQKTDEAKLLAPFVKKGMKANFMRTGLDVANGEQGVLLSTPLVELANDPKKDQLREKFWGQLSPEVASTILRKDVRNVSDYYEKTELSFAYTHSDTKHFLKVHQLYTKDSSKSR